MVGGKLNLGGFYRRLGVAKEAVQQGARAGLLSEARGFSSDERAAVRREMEAIYETFLERVAHGRRIPRKALEAIAQGRIWSGRRAESLGLIDALGGPLDAFHDLIGRAGLHERESFNVRTLPRVARFSNIFSLPFGLSGTNRTFLPRAPWLGS